jgi:hypothetical protein
MRKFPESSVAAAGKRWLSGVYVLTWISPPSGTPPAP